MADSCWNTIDSDAGVFTELCEKLDIKDVQFEDLFSIDEYSLKSFAPLYGVIFLFKYGSVDRTPQPLEGEYDYDSKIFFAKQTIQNACATQAVLNVLLNKTDIVDIGPELTNFKSFVDNFDSELQGETISNSEKIRTVHNSFSSPNPFIDESDTQQPSDEKNDGVYHFVGFVRIGDHIYELDGLRNAPIRHVECKTDDEFFTKLPDVLNKRISHYGSSESRFSLLAITRNRIKTMKEIGDEDAVQNEIIKRQDWARENELRRQDFIGLLYEVTKDIGASMSNSEWSKLLQEGGKKSQERMLAQMKRHQGFY